MMRQAAWISLLVLLAGCNRTPVDEGRAQKPVADQKDRSLTLGDAQAIEATPFVTIPMRIEGSDDSYSLKGGNMSEERNRIILDTRTGQSRKLLPDEGLTITQWSVLRDKPASNSSFNDGPVSKPGDPVADLFAVVIRHPAIEHWRPTYDLMLGTLSRGTQQLVLRGADDVQSTWLLRDGQIAAIVTEAGKPVYRTFDPQTYRPARTAPLAF